jgi:hypothetical protein
MIDKTLMKDSMGRYRTNLFHEFNTTAHEDYPPMYTMREEPFAGLPSAYQIYMAADSEYEAAQAIVGSWHHWQKLLTCPPFMNGPKNTHVWTGLNQWREEKEIQDRAEAYMQLKQNAAGGNVQAQKLIFEGSKKRGRPSNAEIKKAAEDRVKNTKSIKDDLARIRLATENGNKARGS